LQGIDVTPPHPRPTTTCTWAGASP
jgi:hypothetical protein